MFMDSDGSVHIYETSKPLDEQPKEPQYRYVQVSIDEVIQNYGRKTYYHEEDGYDGLMMVYADTRFKISDLVEARFYKREEF